MKKILIVLGFLLAFSSVSVFAQNTNYVDVVYLKNGSIIHGMIIEQIPNQSIKIQTKDGDIFVYKMDDIEKITKEPATTSDKNTSSNYTKNNGSSPSKSSTPIPIKYTNIAEGNVGLGLGDNSAVISLGIQDINGIMFNNFFITGIGIGYNTYMSDIGKYSSVDFLPIFIDARAYILKQAFTPYVGFNIGYSLLLSNNDTKSGSAGGLLINPELGIKYSLNDKVALNFAIGYMLQDYVYAEQTLNYSAYYYYVSKTELSANASFLNFTFGVTF